MANTEGLKPVRSKEEASERGRKGGIASGKARRAKKNMRQMLEMFLEDVPLSEGWQKLLQNMGLQKYHFNHKAVVTMKLIQKAEEGDVSAYNAIAAMVGEKPTDKVENSIDLNMKIEYVDCGHDLASDEEDIEG